MTMRIRAAIVLLVGLVCAYGAWAQETPQGGTIGSDPGQIASQHALNQRYLQSYAGPVGAGPAVGRWTRAVDGAMYTITGAGDQFAETIWLLAADGTRIVISGKFVLDPARGTITYYRSEVANGVLRVAAARGTEFDVEVLPELGITPAQALEQSFRLGFESTYLTRGPERWEWLAEADAIALSDQVAVARRIAIAQQQAAQQAALAQNSQVAKVYDPSGILVMGADGEWEAADGDWDDDEDRALFDMEQGGYAAPTAASDSPMKGLYDALVEANAAADAHLQQTQAAYDATMAEARRQAAYERAQAATAGAKEDADARRLELENAQQATQRQYEIARQLEAQRQASEAARAEQVDAQLQVTQEAQAAQQRATGSTQSSGSSGPGESIMGFNGRTCAEARLGAQNWVGSGGTFEVKSEEVQSSGLCLVQIHNWHSGPGTASRQ